MPQCMRTLMEDALAPLELQPKHYAMLKLLAADGPLSQQLIGERLRIDRTSVMNIVDALERGGTAARRQDPRNRRPHLVGLTDAGTVRLTQAETAVSEAEGALFAPLSAQDRRQLHTLLKRVCGY